MKPDPFAQPRKTADICLYLFNMLCAESKRMTPGEMLVFERVISERGPLAKNLAAVLTNYFKALKL